VKRIILLVMLFMIIGVLISSVTYGAEIVASEYAITHSQKWDTMPRLGNDGVSDLVVFTRRELLLSGLGQGDIWFKRLVNGQPSGPAIQVTTALTDDQLNDVSGDFIVYTAYDSVTSDSGRIMLYQVSTGMLFSIANSSVLQEPRISGTKIVWRQGGTISAQVMLYDISWLGTSHEAEVLAGPVPPTFAVDIGERFVVWEELSGGQFDVVAYDLVSNTRIAVTTTESTNENEPSTSGEWVTWQAQDKGSSSSRILAKNLVTGEERIIVDNGVANYEPSINGDLIAYESMVTGNLDVFVYRISTGETFQVTTDLADQYLNDVFGDMIAYVDQRNGNKDIYVAKLQKAIAGPEIQVNTYSTSHQEHPAVAMDANGNFVIAWMSYWEDGSYFGVYAQRYDSAGNPLGSEFRVNTNTTGHQQFPAVAMDADGNFVIAWDSNLQDGDSFGVYAQRYDSAGNPVGSEFQVNTYTTSYQSFPSVAMDADGNFVITWESNLQDGDGFGVYAQRYDSAGNPVGAEFRVNTYTTSYQSFPSVAMDADGNFVITWESNLQDGDGIGVYAQRYDSEGNPVGSELQVNTHTISDQDSPSVAIDANGNFVVAWESNMQDGNYYGVYAQRYDSTGNPVGTEFQVNTYTISNQSAPSVAMDADGNFVITWYSYVQDGSDTGIYAQRYNNAGNPVGSEFRVNTCTTDYQLYPSVAMDANGNLVIAWESNMQDGDGFGIFMKHYFYAPLYSGQYTTTLYPGTDVTVVLDHQIELTFSNVISGGSITATVISPDDLTAPANFELLGGSAFDISTDATFSGQITVCIGYNPALLVGINEEDLRLFHYVGGVPEDITQLPVDTVNKKVCGITNSLSPFAIAAPIPCTDIDNDGYAVEGGACGPVDCNDNDASINPGASDNSCDGIDNNCNGQVDEGYTPTQTTCGVGVCASTGLLACVNGSLQDTCTAGNPTGNDDNCNGIDENCSGTADENYVPISTTCGIGACGATGKLICSAGTEVNTCTPGSPQTEVCDGVDNDCDGAIDENLGTTTCGVGACQRTVDNCINGIVQTCTPGSPSSEVCDGIDNNCNGLVDEDLTQQCGVSDIGACRYGTQTCSNGSWGSCVGNVDPTAEICDDGIDNDCNGEDSVKPAISPDTIVAPGEPIPVSNASATISFNFTDDNSNDTHTIIFDWGDGNTSEVNPQTGSRTAEDTHVYSQVGVYAVTLSVTDNVCESASAEYRYIVVYDPNGGFVTGGGWINSPEGALTANPSLTGKANFGFVSKYKKGATIPTGNTEFQFKVADLNFHSETHQWLVIAGAKAQYKGTGTINGEGNYGFMLTAIDGDIKGGVDKFRMKIWDKDNNDEIVYDNQLGDSDDSDPTTIIGGGSIVIHKK
jgi:hypothetical protein